MNALIIFCYIIMAYGLTNLLVNGRGPYDILTNFRDSAKAFLPGLGDMLDCMMCTSTNVGLIMSVISMNIATPFTPFTVLMPEQCWLLVLLLDMFVTSGAVWLVDAVELFFERLGEKAMSETTYVREQEIDTAEELNETRRSGIEVSNKRQYLTFTRDVDTLNDLSDYIITTTDGSNFRYYIDLKNVYNVQVEKGNVITVELKDNGVKSFTVSAGDIEIIEDWRINTTIE